MPSFLGAMRQYLLAPRLSAVTLADRDLPGAASPSAQRLEAIPQAVVCGFEWGMAARDLWEVERRLELVEVEHRGFAYEGAAMAFTVRDVMAGGRGRRTERLLRGPGARHLLLAYIGIGFAMARLPRPLWRHVIPDLDGMRYHPTMSWLAVDGYGFDLAYFKTRLYVGLQRVPAPYPFQGTPDYFPRAVDQGIGRALWFVHGGDPSGVVAAVNAFDEPRRADLWSGVGLAATFAGGCEADGLAAVRDAAGPHRSQLALGAVFAITARHAAGFVAAHSRLGTEMFTGLSVEQAVALADRTEANPAEPTTAEPLYEQWRSRIRAHFLETASPDDSKAANKRPDGRQRHANSPTAAGSSPGRGDTARTTGNHEG